MKWDSTTFSKKHNDVVLIKNLATVSSVRAPDHVGEILLFEYYLCGTVVTVKVTFVFQSLLGC